MSSPQRYNASLLLDQNLKTGRADKIAIHWGDETVTYGELFELMCRAGNALRELGLGREDRMLMVLDDRPTFPAIFLGAIRIGAVPVPLNPLYSAEDYRHFVEDSGAKLLILDPDRAEKVIGGLGDAAASIRILTTGGAAAGLESFDDLTAAESSELPPANTRRDDVAFWLYSSGSTGKPKGVVHLQHDISVTCDTYARHVLEIEECDVTFSSTKLFHAYGLGNNLSFPYSVGASSVLLSGRPTPETLFATIARYRPTLFFSVPTLYNAALNTPEAASADLSSVRTCISAAEPLPSEVWHRWKGAFGLEILDGIGSTEMLHSYCSNGVGTVQPGSSGRPVPGYELRILDGDWNELGEGEVGDLWVRGDSVFAFYWGQPEKTADTLKDSWFYSGDRYRRDEGGCYWYEGRADDMIRVSGLWVSPIEVESALVEHPAVFEAAVVGVPVDGFIRVKAFVILKDVAAVGETLEKELLSFCAGRLHGYQRPQTIEFVEDLPRTVTGKIRRSELRAVER